MKPTGCPDFEVELPRPGSAGCQPGSAGCQPAVVKAADFGFSEASTDNIAAINAALAEARRIGAARVELAPGTYRCFDPAARTEAPDPAHPDRSNDQTTKRPNDSSGVVIEGFTDFTFDGCGATLVFRRERPPLPSQDTLLPNGANVTVRGCLRTVVRNFHMDWDWENDPLAVWCRCDGNHVDDADNASWIDLELEAPHPKYPQHVPVQLLTPFTDDKSGWRMDVANGPRCYLGTSLGCIGAKSEWLSPARLRVWPCVRPDYGYVPPEQEAAYGPAPNRELAERARVGGLYSLSHCYYGLNGIVVDSNEHLTLRDIDVWSCCGFGVETRGSQRFWQLVNVNVRPKPGTARPVTSTADAHHVIQSRGFGKMVGCEVAWNQDDYFNYHDRTQIAQTRDPRTVEVVNSRGIVYSPFRVGSRVRLKQEDFSDAGWTGVITAIDGERVAFDRDLPEQTGILFVLVDDEFATENFLFKDCRFHDSPWARGIVQGNNVTFEGCAFGPMSGLPLLLMACYTYNVWCEGIGCRNIVVRGCRFENCLSDNSWHVEKAAPQIKASIRLPPEFSRMESTPIENAAFAAQVAANIAAGRQVRPSPDAVSDILVERCTFVNPRGPVFLGENASRVTFRDNQILSDGGEWEPLPTAGKILVRGGSGNDEQANGNRPPRRPSAWRIPGRASRISERRRLVRS